MNRFAPHLLAAAALLGTSNLADARPVSYPGGWTAMQMNNGGMSSLHVHYSPTARDSIGVYGERNFAGDWWFAGAQYNRLVKRWNGTASQANLYAKFGAGLSEDDGSDDTSPAAFADIAFDWETRRWFTAYEARGYALGSNGEFRQSGRVGVAPYIGDYGDVHTWLMLQVDHMPEDAGSRVQTTPLVRLFYNVQLLELGYTVETEKLMVNWIVRF